MTLEFSSVELSRLDRDNPGWDADSLAQEIKTLFPFAIRDIPAASLQATATDASPSPIKITDNTTDGNIPFMTIKRGDSSIHLTFNSTGQLVSNQQPQQTGAAASKSNSFPGQVLGYNGGNVYLVTIYPNGTTNAGQVVLVKQLEGYPTFPHADGRWAIVTKCGSEYSMQIPVWG